MPVLRGMTDAEAQGLGLPSGTCEVTSAGAKTATTHTHGRWRQAKDYLLPPDPSQPGKLSYQMHIGRDVHYQDDGGNWRNIDLNWQADPANPGEFVTDRNDIYTRVTRFGVAVWDRKRRIGIRWSTTVRPDVLGRQASFPKDGLIWKWSATTSGLKLESEPVVSPRGPQTYEWRYLVIDLNRTDGLNLAGTLAVDAGGNLVGDGFVTPRAYAIGKNNVRYDCGPWQTVGGKTRAVSFAFDDSTLPPEAFPYTIDPTTTFGVAASGDDGYVERNGATYPPTTNTVFDSAFTLVVVGRYKESASYSIVNGLMRWDTSIIPDTATVNSATLRANVTSTLNTDTRNLTADWYPGTSWPIDAADYSETAQTTALAGTSIASITTSADNDFVLTGAAANVSLTGYTGLRLHVSGGVPTDYNFVQIAAFDHATLAEPRLIIDYTDGVAPTPVTYTVALAVAAVSIGTVATKRIRVRSLPATMIGAPSVGRVRTAIRKLSIIIATAPQVVTRKTIRKALAAVATGVATLARTVTYRRTLATAMLGVVAMPKSRAKGQALSVVTVVTGTLTRVAKFSRRLTATTAATATLNRLATFRRTLSATAMALPKLSKRMFVRLSVQSTVTATLSRARLRTRALAAVAGSLVGLTATFVKGTAVVMRRSLWRAYNLFARTKREQ